MKKDNKIFLANGQVKYSVYFHFPKLSSDEITELQDQLLNHPDVEDTGISGVSHYYVVAVSETNLNIPEKQELLKTHVKTIYDLIIKERKQKIKYK